MRRLRKLVAKREGCTRDEIFRTSVGEQIDPLARIEFGRCEVGNEVVVDDIATVVLEMVVPEPVAGPRPLVQPPSTQASSTLWVGLGESYDALIPFAVPPWRCPAGNGEDPPVDA